jgi:hypothetical protein
MSAAVIVVAAAASSGGRDGHLPGDLGRVRSIGRKRRRSVRAACDGIVRYDLGGAEAVSE